MLVRLSLVVLSLFAFASGATGVAGGARVADAPRDGALRVFVGTYTRGTSKGIYRLDLDARTGQLSTPVLAAETPNPSFLAAHPGKPWLYAANENGSTATGPNGETGGGISAFAINADGTLAALNQQWSGGRGPAYVALDRTGSHVLAANYGSGSIASIRIEADGRLGALTSVIQHEGSSVHPQRQQGPHAHSVIVEPANRFAVAADLGIDRLMIYRFNANANAASGVLAANDPPSAAAAPGSGPRHLAFSPDGRSLYVTNEMKSSLSVFTWDKARGVATHVQTLSTLPEGFSGTNSAAEVQVHPSGKFVYSSNRGHDSIAIFARDTKSGQLRPVGHQPTGGRRPRHFGMDRGGRLLLAANQETGSIVAFRIDARTGRLTPTGSEVALETPVCIRFVEDTSR